MGFAITLALWQKKQGPGIGKHPAFHVQPESFCRHFHCWLFLNGRFRILNRKISWNRKAFQFNLLHGEHHSKHGFVSVHQRFGFRTVPTNHSHLTYLCKCPDSKHVPGRRIGSSACSLRPHFLHVAHVQRVMPCHAHTFWMDFSLISALPAASIHSQLQAERVRHAEIGVCLKQSARATLRVRESRSCPCLENVVEVEGSSSMSSGHPA